MTPLVPADYLDIFDPLRAGADLRARVLSVTPETGGATTITLRPGRSWRGHRPGQYIRIGVDVDGVRRWRAYSLTQRTASADGTLSITVRTLPGGLVSNHVREGLAVGSMVMLDQAAGDFVQPATVPDKVLFVTAGSGITPVIGMLRNHDFPDAVLVHSAPTAADMLFHDELAALQAEGRLHLVTRFTSEEGILPAERIGDVVPDWQQREAWVCGPVGLLDDAEAHWESAGLAELLHTERFRPVVAATGEGGLVTFTRTDLVIDTAGDRPLLDSGEDAGVLMPSGCRMGICFNCVSPLTSGSVRDLRTGELTTAEPEDPVMVQTCVSAAAGPCSIDL
ncbi:Ferredoxin-NADP reductase [Raineyella antarctica]|uniref:Ferredoxin-NADP reductase n=1 Tax=Raineyella antarctica TaxID=1577474 RepID=A0A1G6GYG0_9ACTN|nr:ferredoxin reductase [Raineyella antarctica]SDB86991.1 Ferredoxin-NADP reductase [Raineyella antarctica]